MTGVRQTRSITCSSCGASGTVKLGMATVHALELTKEFECVNCGNTISVSAPRAILDLDWERSGVGLSEEQEHPPIG